MTPSAADPGGSTASGSLTVPDEVPEIGPELTGLCEASPAGARPFLAEGAGLWVAGTEARAGFTVGAGSTLLAEVTPSGLGTAANVLLFPGVVRRDFPGAGGSVVESVVVSNRLPLLVAQWAGSRDVEEEARAPRKVVVELPTGAADDARLRRSEDHVTVETPGRTTALAVVPPPLAVGLEQRDDGHARATFTLAPGPTPSLLVASGSPDRVATSLAGARYLEAHAVQAAAGPGEGLRVRSGVPEIDDGVLWLRARVSGQAARAVRPRLSVGLAALATGDRDAASALLALDDENSAARALVAARLASVFGNTGPAGRIAQLWSGGDAPAPSPMTALAAGALARALDRSLHPDAVARLREMAEAATPTRRGERRLPTVGASGDSDPGDPSLGWWRALLEGRPSGPAPAHRREEIVEARHACGAFPTAPDEAWARWRRLLTESTSGGASTLWDPSPAAGISGRPASGPDRDRDRDGDEDEGADEGSLAAELVLALVHGLLGVEADAPVGRLRIAPRLPSHLRSFSVEGIRVGEAVVSLEYRRREGRHVFELSPQAAPIPPLLVFEPSVPGTVQRVEVDGEAADLELDVREGRTGVPVQLPLDQTRVVVVETSA